MPLRRMSIRLNEHERKLMVKLYLRWRIPIDQFDQRPEDKSEFVAEWNRLSKRRDDAADVIHYMKTQRKRNLWVKLENKCLPTPQVIELSAEETEILVRIFRENVTILNYGSDVLSVDDELVQLIVKIFAEETGRFVPPHELVAKLTALRKRGLLSKVEDQGTAKDDDDYGFEDADAV